MLVTISIVNSQREKFLVFRIRTARDENAFKELLTCHGKPVARFLRSKLPTTQDADDAFSSVAFGVWNHLTTSQNIQSIIGLFFLMARNAVADFYRKRGPETVSIEALESVGTEPRSHQSAAQVIAQVDLTLVCKVMDRLSDDYREVIILRCFEGLSNREVAGRLRRSENATYVLFHRAIKELRNLLGHV